MHGSLYTPSPLHLPSPLPNFFARARQEPHLTQLCSSTRAFSYLQQWPCTLLSPMGTPGVAVGMAMYTNLHYHHQYEREQLFEKPLTPSDVGKLNRLVIPKQHAERYFPIGGAGDGGEKGLLLSFEDEAGKPWRFRYSYWTSSQSYVLTKGWSRYVKEKRLDAGDVVRFERVRGGLGVGDRLFIGCRRRGESAPLAPTPPPVRAPTPAVNGGEQQQPWSPMCYSTSGSSYPTSPASSYAYHSDMPHAGETTETKSSGAASAPSRKLRLFGVNLDCGPEPEPETPTAMYGYMHQQSPYAAVSAVPNYWEEEEI